MTVTQKVPSSAREVKASERTLHDGLGGAELLGDAGLAAARWTRDELARANAPNHELLIESGVSTSEEGTVAENPWLVVQTRSMSSGG